MHRGAGALQADDDQAAGLGLGACLPTALAYMSEHAPKGSNSKAVTRTMTGYHVGAVLTALLALWLVEDFGWDENDPGAGTAAADAADESPTAVEHPEAVEAGEDDEA